MCVQCADLHYRRDAVLIISFCGALPSQTGDYPGASEKQLQLWNLQEARDELTEKKLMQL